MRAFVNYQFTKYLYENKTKKLTKALRLKLIEVLSELKRCKDDNKGKDCTKIN